jgi:hypothetical protein
MKLLYRYPFSVVCLCLCLTSLSAGEPNKPALSSSSLSALIQHAKKLAITQMPDIPPKSYSKGSVSVYFASRTSGTPDGVMVSFPIRGSHRTEKLGEMEDRIIVILYDDTARKADVKKISRWLYEDSIALKEY